MTVQCTCCGKEASALAEAPFRDDMGQEILVNTCRECWAEWLALQVKLINEYGLLPVNPEHGAVLEKNLKGFLKLPSAAAESVDEVGDPEAAKG
ncbi:MAG: Fe(2+)-trafficking protein [Planctomycetota bacterium]|jgi:Fe-S cluster biosynthesis and repair protein YggX